MGISHSFWIFFVIFARDPKTYALGPILVIFEVCHFVMIPKLESLSIYQKKRPSQKNQSSDDEGAMYYIPKGTVQRRL